MDALSGLFSRRLSTLEAARARRPGPSPGGGKSRAVRGSSENSDGKTNHP